MSDMGMVYDVGGGNVTDPKFPITRNDPGLTEGSLWLFDATRTLPDDFNFLSTGGPALYNVAEDECMALTGCSQADTQSRFVNTFTAGHALFERTPRGGMHGIVTKTNQTTTDAAFFTLSEPVRQWLLAHSNDTYAAFAHFRTTRGRTSPGSVADFQVASQSSPSANRLILGNFNHSVGAEVSAGEQAGFSYHNATVGFTTLYTNLPVWGSAQGYGGLSINLCASYVLYRFHLINLTASGLTYEAALALDTSVFENTFGVGGKYYGDTIPTSPDMLP